VDFRFPTPLGPGSLVAIVAPASPIDQSELFRGLAWLRTRYRLKISTAVFERAGYLAGADDHRLSELARAMLDPEVEAIVCARGGYGAMRIVDGLPWNAFASSPKWLAGFSDITTLHAFANRAGICTLHSPNATGLGRTITPDERAALLDALEGGPQRAWSGLQIVHRGANGRGRASGPVLGGNLALVCALAAAGRLAFTPGSIVLLEEVTEPPYRIDRMLTSLRLGGHLAHASAIVFGGLTRCMPGPDGITAEDVVRERTSDLGIPVLANAPFGHGAPNRSVILGARGFIENGTLSFSEQPNR
jgi:muramoyltetrapeptide carboxypeptidase